MTGIIPQKIALLFWKLKFSVHSDYCYLFSDKEIKDLDFTNLESEYIGIHDYSLFETISDEEKKSSNIVFAFTYSEAIDLLREKYGLYISVAPYKTYSTNRGYAYAATVYDLLPKWKDKSFVYPVYTWLCREEKECLDDVLYSLLTDIVKKGRKTYPYILWLDDLRDPEIYPWKNKINNELDLDVEWCFNKQEFIDTIIKRGIPKRIYFDHDLGNPDMDQSGYGCALWLVEYMMDHDIDPNGIEIHSQSDNQPGKENILALMNNYKKHYNTKTN